MKNRNAIAKRQQKKHLQKLSKAKAARPHIQRTRDANDHILGEIRAFEVSGLHNHWIAHVANFLVSDYKRGTWRPIFDEIYEGQLIAIDTMLQRTDTFYRIGDKDEYQPEGMLLLGWFLQPVDVKYRLFKEAIARLKQRYPLDEPMKAIQRPHEPEVWEMIQEFRKILDTEE